ncbi:MAG TPA: hypothetical protein VG796_27450 [Verrucomicrobiales bacterium]|jgi:hypothetical protein|nr:hypothetical protein [Verrucomicrobiales bacterium]
MHIPRWFIWLLLYAAAIFSWSVFFEHGAGGQNFQEGAAKEWDRIWDSVQGWIRQRRGS